MSGKNEEFYQEYAKHLSRRIQPSEEIKSLIGGNSELMGSFAEAQVRKFVREMLFPLHVSHGAVLASDTFDRNHVKQVDTIVWVPNPLPPLIEVDEFVLIARESSMGVLEIKSSAYSRAVDSIVEMLDMECELTIGRRPAETRGIPAALGIIVLEKESAPLNSEIRDLMQSGRVVVLLHQEGNDYRTDTASMLRFVNFLAGVRKRALLLGDLRVDRRRRIPVEDDSSTAHS